MVLGSLLLAVALVLMLGKLPGPFKSTYSIFVWFPQIPGVAEGTPVRKDGLLIGRVTDVKLLENGVVVTVEIDSKYKLRRNEVCRLTSNLLGDASLQFVRSAGASEEFIQNGDYMEGSVAANPMQAFDALQGDFNEAIASINMAGREVGRLAETINQFMANNDEQLNRIVNKTERALDGFQKAVGDLDSLLGDEKTRAGLRDSIANLPDMLTEAREAIAGIRAATKLADANLQGLQGLTGPLGDRGPAMVESIDVGLSRLSELLAQFVQFGKKLNSGQGTVGQLLNNKELYDHVNAAVCNIEKLTKELTPIVDNVNAFTDKLARHPGMLLRDAVKPNSGIK